MRNFVIRCPIHGSINLEASEVKILDTKVMQRLRHIRQLGIADYVYPGATHHRLGHTLGVLFLSTLVFKKVTESSETPLNEYFSKEQLKYLLQTLRIASLTHDTGHLPFSHTLEDYFLKSLFNKKIFEYLPPVIKKENNIGHETISYALAIDLAKKGLFSIEQAYDVIALLSGNIKLAKLSNFTAKGINIFNLLSCIINSYLDVDRMDYLLRDSYHSGVAYGNFDLAHLVSCLDSHVTQSNQIELALDQSGILTYEDLLFSRKIMFSQLYYHKTLLGFAEVLKKAIETKQIQVDFGNNLDEYLDINDADIYQQIFKNSTKFWCKQISTRKALKVIVRFENANSSQKKEFLKIANDLKQQKKIFFVTKKEINIFKRKNKLADNVLLISKKLGKKQILSLGKLNSEKRYGLLIDQISLLKV